MMQVLLRMFQRNLVVNPPMQLRAVVLLTAILAYGTSGFLYFELPANPDLAWTDALWYSMVTLTTVGYGDFFPKTAGGRFLVGVPLMVIGIAADQSGRIYLCTTRGVARLTPRTPDVLDGSRFGLELISLEDGLPSSDCQQGARLVDADGRIWFGTARGLAMYDPRLERPDDRAKPLWIDRVELSDGRQWRWSYLR